MAPLSAHQIWACVVAERISASVSIFGTLMMLMAFYLSPNPKRFHTLSNTLLIYASFANLGSNAAALIGGSGLSRVSSPMCQAQAFLLEWFMQTDPMWGTCMAFNVYLVIFRRWTAQQVKGVFKYYFPICYVVPMIPALTCLIYKNKQHGRMYGNAGIWCWIDNDWADVRIYAYYGPVWIYLMVTFTIYLRVGIEIFRKRSALLAFGTGGSTHTSLTSTSASQMSNRNSRSSVASFGFNLPSFTGTRTTEVEVTSTQNNLAALEATDSRPSSSQKEGNFVDITANKKDEDTNCNIWDIPRVWYAAIRRHFDGMDKIKLAYTKCALLFACSIVVTWVPSSANRVYGLNHGTNPSFALNIAAAAVLPLQGFWNTAIFFWTSWSNVKLEYRHWRRKKALQRARKQANTSSPQHNMEGAHGININHLGGERGGPETESTRDVLEEEDTRNTSAEHFEDTKMSYDEEATSAADATSERVTSRG